LGSFGTNRTSGIGVQVGLILAANLIAFVLRFEGQIPSLYMQRMTQGFPIVALIYGLCLWGFGIQRGVWRYVGHHDLARILWASITSTAVLYSLIHWLLGWTDYSRSVIILTGLLAAGFLTGIRLAVRWFREWLQIVGPKALRVSVQYSSRGGSRLLTPVSGGGLQRLVDHLPGSRTGHRCTRMRANSGSDTSSAHDLRC
jgi:FlaA1/EpsC-like NDP-sugar epimerase